MIKPQEFVYRDNRWQDMYAHLKSKGFDVYSPAQKVGECTSPYLVIKNDGGYLHPSYSTTVDQYSIYCFVPKNKYSELETLVRNVKISMKELYPMFQIYGQELASFYDDTVKAHYISIEYKNYKKVEFM